VNDIWGYDSRHRRVGREDRERYIEHLSEMYSLEYLDSGEFEERARKAAEAKFEFDLTSLVTDLPAMPAKMAVAPKEETAAAKAVVEKPKPQREPMSLAARFSLGTLFSLIVLCVPIPIAAHLWHGLGNAPWVFIFPSILGALGTFVCGISALITWLEDY
jgi:hypothetical protein